MPHVVHLHREWPLGRIPVRAEWHRKIEAQVMSGLSPPWVDRLRVLADVHRLDVLYVQAVQEEIERCLRPDEGVLMEAFGPARIHDEVAQALSAAS